MLSQSQANFRCDALATAFSYKNVGLSWWRHLRTLLLELEVSILLIKSKFGFKGEKDVRRPRLVASRSAVPKTREKGVQGTSGDYRLHIVMDRESLIKLRALKAQLEASTEAEVIRRALKAFEVFEPADDALDGMPDSSQTTPSEDIEHLYIRIPTRMKEQLDSEQLKTGRTYGVQVRQALRVFSQLTRDLENLKRSRDKGKESSDAISLRSLKMAVAS